jgi:pilus assembly protein FimV
MANLAVQPARTADGRDVIRLRSTQAMIEPFVTVLVEVNWARGKLVREYTMLLDPPVYTPGQAAGASAPVAAPTAGDSARAGAISRAAEPAEQAVPTESPQDSPNESRSAASVQSAAAGSSRVVRRGDTLSGIAGEVSGGDTRASRRWMVAIYRSNPRAFDGNMNILRSGAELQIPDNSTVEGISASDATSEIRQQYAAWRGTVAPTGEVAAEEPGRLKLVPPAAAAAAGAGASTAAPANPALQARVRELEAQLVESRRLIELRNSEVAQLQARLASQQGARAPAAEPTPAGPAEPTPPAESPETAQTPPAEETPAAEPTPATPPPEDAAKPAASETPAEGSLLDKVKEFWWAGVALLVALLALLGLRAWRARQQSEFDDSLGRLASGDAGREFNAGDTAPIRAIGPEPGFLVEETGTHERPRFTAGPGDAPIAPPNVATEDTISSETAINLDQGDPLAEADFHMAYGLYDQAADLVRIAIAREPDRRDLKLKLLEVFFVWGNKEQFLCTARELAGTRDQAAPGEWEKIVIMGKQLAPEDELFGSSASYGAAAAGGVDLDLEGGQSRVDFDLLGEPVPGADGVDLDIGSALGDKDATAESPTRTTDAHLALHESDVDDSASATTREMTQRVSPEPAPLIPDYDVEGSEEAPTVEQPAMYGEDHPTIRQKVDVALRQDRSDQTAELAIDDLGLDLTALDTVDQPGLGSSPDAPTLVAGLDEQSRRMMEDAELLGAKGDDEATGPSSTGAWRVRPEDLDPTMPPTNVQALEGDISATSRMSAISEEDIDFDFDAVGGDEKPGANGGLDLDVGTATVPDAAYTATQRISSEDLALPDLEPATMSEVGTKLDLARAYMDMGDPEGARNILEEVLQEGSVNQKQEAQRLIDSLPG